MSTLGRHSWSESPPLKGVSVQVKVVADQPWDVKADVLAVPILGEPAFSGPLGELDRRAGGELQSLADFGELKGKRFKSDPRRRGRGDGRPARWRSSRATPPSSIARPSSRSARAAERRLAGRQVRSLAIWVTPLAERLEGGAAAVAELARPRRRRGQLRPGDDLPRRTTTDGPPALDELILVAPGEDAARAGEGRRARRDHRRGREHRPDALEPRRRTTSAPRSSPRRPTPSPRSTACGSTSSARRRPPRWAWACSWPSAGAATTRRG